MSVWKARLVGVLVLVSLGAAAKLPRNELDPAEMARRFHFDSTTLDYPSTVPKRETRDVHKSLQKIQPWIASVGAGAAIGDVDGNLKPDEACLVDTRTNEVRIVPLLGQRFDPFVLTAPATREPAASIAPMGCLIADLNEDGLPDLLVYYWGRPPVAFLRIDTGKATLASAPSAGAYAPVALGPDERWFSNAALLADIDGDGHLDLVVGNYFCDGARILDSVTDKPACPHPVMQDSMSRAFNGGTNRILLWSAGTGGVAPDVRFEDLPGVFPEDIANGWTLAIAAQDLDGDGYPDLYFANDFGPDRLLVNCAARQGETARAGCFPQQGRVAFRLIEGRRSFTMPRSKVLGKDSFKGMGVEFGDINGDGVADIFVSNITEKWALQESQFAFVRQPLRQGETMDDYVRRGEAPFSDQSEDLGLSRSGWAWDAKLADFDNDGKPEALQAVGFVRGTHADDGWLPHKSHWANLQELATANDIFLKHVASWFDMAPDSAGIGADLSGNSRTNPFAVMQPSGRYADASAWLPHLRHGAPAPTRGLAIGDADLDGYLDYIEAKQFAAAEFHHNRPAGAGRQGFIGVSPRFLVAQVGPGSAPLPWSEASRLGARSRPAFGVYATFTLSDGRTFHVEVDGGNGHSGKRSPDLHVGLGRVAPGTTARMQLSWHSLDGKRIVREFDNVALNTHQFVFLAP
jgi:hypothetical protein